MRNLVSTKIDWPWAWFPHPQRPQVVWHTRQFGNTSYFALFLLFNALSRPVCLLSFLPFSSLRGIHRFDAILPRGDGQWPLPSQSHLRWDITQAGATIVPAHLPIFRNPMETPFDCLEFLGAVWLLFLLHDDLLFLGILFIIIPKRRPCSSLPRAMQAPCSRCNAHPY